MSILEQIKVPYFKKGSKIHIKEKNKGKFTQAAKQHGMGVQEFVSHVLNNKDKYSPTLVKRANFAYNAKAQKHQSGQKIFGIPKGQLGLITKLNPKNWGVKEYSTKTFSEAFNQAEQEGEKEFLWRGKRYAVKRAKMHDFNDQLNWFKEYVNNYQENDVDLSPIDSLDAIITASDKKLKLYKDTSISYDEFQKQRNIIDSLKYQNFRKSKLDSVKYRVNNINIDLNKMILTTQPDPKYNTKGWYNKINDIIYSSDHPGTFVHELSHKTGADKLKYLQPSNENINNDYYYNNLRLDYLKYLLDPDEMGARYIQNMYLKDKNLPLSEYYIDKQFTE